MKFPGRLYEGKQGLYLALYNNYDDIYLACPDSLEGKKRVYADPVKTWTENSRRLEKLWGNDPRKLRAETVKQTIENISPIDLNDAFWAIGKYKCGKKNALYCLGNCEIECKTKVYTEKQFTTLKLEQDTRKNKDNLFSK